MRWDGSAWADVAFPASNGLKTHSALTSIAFASPSDGWAVGYRQADNGAQPVVQPLILHWDGTAWN